MDELRKHIAPYEGIIRFVVAMLAANYFWKFTVMGDENGIQPVTWFGLDLTWYFDVLCDHVAGGAYALLHGIGVDIVLRNGNRLFFPETHYTIGIVWGCTGIKQSFIWLIIMLAARGKWRQKLCYIPVGWAFAYAFNIFRIAAVGLLCMNHPDRFELLHTYLFKYLFYAAFFALWLIYDLFIVGERNKPEQERRDSNSHK